MVFKEIIGALILFMVIGFYFGHTINELQDKPDTFMILDGCDEFRASCNHIVNVLIDENYELNEELNIKNEELKTKDKEMKSEAFKHTTRERKIAECLFIMIAAIFYSSYLLLDKYINFKREESTKNKDRDEKKSDKDVE